MTGSEKSGIDAADPFLFENAIYVVTPDAAVPEKVLHAYLLLLESIGARVAILDAATHDRIAAAVSHLPQIAAVTLTNLVGGLNEQNQFYLKMAAGGFRDMTRIASSPFSIWNDICATNAAQIQETIDSFISELATIKRLVGEKSLGEQFDLAAKNRLSIPKDSKGFIKPLYELSVVVEDKPGVIAFISNILFNAGINIKDIEVLKVREGDGGTLRIALESEPDRNKALELFERKGLSCRKLT